MTSPIRPLLGVLLLLSSGGYALAQVQSSQSAPTAQTPPARPEAVSQVPPVGRPSRQSPSAPTNDVDLTSVQIFQLDDQCEDYEGSVQQLPRTTALSDAVGAAVQESGTLDFRVAGYRVTPGPAPGEVTVDLRLPPGDQRGLESLSICEGRSLYGSIQRTLMANGQFGVDRVRFTAAGRELR